MYWLFSFRKHLRTMHSSVVLSRLLNLLPNLLQSIPTYLTTHPHVVDHIAMHKVCAELMLVS